MYLIRYRHSMYHSCNTQTTLYCIEINVDLGNCNLHPDSVVFQSWRQVQFHLSIFFYISEFYVTKKTSFSNKLVCIGLCLMIGVLVRWDSGKVPNYKVRGHGYKYFL